MLKNLFKLSSGAAIAATLIAGALTITPEAYAEKILKFSHTDNPGGSRQAAAEVFA